MTLSVDAPHDYLLSDRGKLWFYDGSRHVEASAAQWAKVFGLLRWGKLEASVGTLHLSVTGRQK